MNMDADFYKDREKMRKTKREVEGNIEDGIYGPINFENALNTAEIDTAEIQERNNAVEAQATSRTEVVERYIDSDGEEVIYTTMNFENTNPSPQYSELNMDRISRNNAMRQNQALNENTPPEGPNEIYEEITDETRLNLQNIETSFNNDSRFEPTGEPTGEPIVTINTERGTAHYSSNNNNPGQHNI